MKDTFYLIFRVYTAKERPNPKDRYVFYGWTTNKSIIEAFQMQRNMDKYAKRKLTREEMDKFKDSYDEDEITCVEMDYVMLHSAHSDLEIMFVTTLHELKETEYNIQEMAREMCDLSKIKGDGDYLSMIINLKDVYREALDRIGYRPSQLDFDYPSDHDTLMDTIDGAYAEGIVTDTKGSRQIPSQSVIDDVASMSLYSIESFIKALRDDL